VTSFGVIKNYLETCMNFVIAIFGAGSTQAQKWQLPYMSLNMLKTLKACNYKAFHKISSRAALLTCKGGAKQQCISTLYSFLY
jgi:hypothetical protein